MQLNSAKSIANEFVRRIGVAITSAIIIGDIQKNLPDIKNIEISVTTKNRKLLDAVLLECSAPITSSNKKIVRLFQGVKIIIHLQ